MRWTDRESKGLATLRFLPLRTGQSPALPGSAAAPTAISETYGRPGFGQGQPRCRPADLLGGELTRSPCRGHDWGNRNKLRAFDKWGREKSCRNQSGVGGLLQP